MRNYVGYGFDYNDISDTALVKFAVEYDGERLREELTDSSETPSHEDVMAYIEFHYFNVPDFICDVINEKENCRVLSSADSFIMFENMAFLDDSRARAELVPNKYAFRKLIGKYFDTEYFCFDDIYEGNDWTEPHYWLYD